MSVATLSRIENADSSMVTLDQMHALASALHVQPSWLQENPRAFSSSGGAQFRANSRMTKTAQEVVSIRQTLFAELLATLDRTVTLKPTALPTVVSSNTDPLEAAAKTRELLPISSLEPIPNLMRALEIIGVYIGVSDFEEEGHLRNHDASSDWLTLETGRAIPVVLCRKHSSWERTRFSVAHEAGHLVLHRFAAGPDREQEATEFAAELLFPYKALVREWPASTTIMNLLPLKLRWGMSIAALIQHGFRNGLVSEERRISLFKQLSNGRDERTGLRWRQREPGADERPVERPLLVANAIEVGYGLPPNLEKLYLDLPPSPRSEWYREFMPNFACSWSRALDAERQQRAVSDNNNVISLRTFQEYRRSTSAG